LRVELPRQNPLVARQPRALGVGVKLLVELLARTQAREHDLDVFASRSPNMRISCRAGDDAYLLAQSSSTPRRPCERSRLETSRTASGIVMKNRRASGVVTVIGPPRWIWRWNSGITEAVVPSTLPNRTAT